jgi:hypothetical protein
MIKRISTISCCLSAALCFSSVAYGQTPQFTDIHGSYAEASILQLAKQGIITGVAADLFAPHEKVTRNDFIVLMAKTLGIQPYYAPTPTFSDVPADFYGYGYVEAFAKLGFVKGKEDGTLGVSEPIKREDVAVLLRNVLGKDVKTYGEEQQYQDHNQISPYAKEGIAYAKSSGIMQGSKGYFYPQQKLTREEAAVLIMKLYDQRTSEGRLAVPTLPQQSIDISVGEQYTLQIPQRKDILPFTPAFGFDNPSIGTLSPDGVFTATAPGTGLITVNIGLVSYQVPVSVK